ncbi:hypothetical protein IKE80_02520 [Candidatus Saccharibacteria bacterium]|nr:hypothetical protein [Candidatus Saccharibacteria bacterium]MCR5700440.1 hypothetical protein [Candidatus Saccharibacteria bacterium]
MIPRPGDKIEGGDNIDKAEFLNMLKRDFADFNFKRGRKFAFRPPRTIVIGPEEPAWQLLALHEVGHAVSGHKNFETDVGRIKMEMEAWEKARELATRYGVIFDETIVQEELDTYRDWLHQKSRCPKCGLTRFETPDGQYHCPRCENF